MDWTAIIVSKDYSKGILLVGIEYTDGNETFGESIDMTGGTLDVLNQKIQDRLNTLNTTSTLISDVDSVVLHKQPIAFIAKPIDNSIQEASSTPSL